VRATRASGVGAGDADDGAVRAAMSAAEKIDSLPASILLPAQSP
jgi:hypothetical protein